MNFLTIYKENMIERIKLLRPELDEKNIEEIVKREMKKKYKNFECNLESTKTTGMKMLSFIGDTKPIIDPFGTLFQTHENAPNQLADMVDMLLKERKVAKKDKFKYEKEGNWLMYQNADMIQLTLKLLANSFYGASIEANSIFYHPYFGSSVTAAGRIIIMTAVSIFEQFLFNNIIFRNHDDIFIYITDILSEEYSTYINVNNINYKDVYMYLIEKMEQPESSVKLEEYLKTLDSNSLNKIYYKNNLVKIIENSDTLQTLMIEILAKDDFLDPNEPPEHYKVYTDQIWDIIKDWVYFDKLNFYRVDNAMNKTRKAVLTIDTDSNFLYVNVFVKAMCKLFDIEYNTMNRFTITNVAGWFLGKTIACNYALMTKQMGIPEPKRPIINMKNEFYYTRLMLTRNKKNYAGTIKAQEAVIKEVPKLDLKGLAIKKVTVPGPIRSYFTNMLKEDILDSENISLSRIISRYQQLEDTIKESINNGETVYLKPDKVNQIDSYKTPYQIQAVRGSLIWNAIYPQDEITIPNKINVIKTTIDGGKETIENLYDEGQIPEFVRDSMIQLYEDVPELEKYQVLIGIPKTKKAIPEWIIPFIDVQTIVNDNMKSGQILLESLGFKEMTVGKSQIATNIIDL